MTLVTAGSVLAWLLSGTLGYPYEKILSRSILLLAVISLIPIWRAAGLSATVIGLAPVDWRRLGAAYPLGIVMVLPAILFFIVVEFRVWDTGVDYGSLEFLRFVVVAIVSGVLVGVFEETLFRGVLFSALRRSSSIARTSVVVSVLYASVHFLRPDEAAVADVSWYTGYIYVFHALSRVAAVADYADSFIALFLLGVLLCWVREWFGLWCCIGLHAAWVFAIRLFKEATVRDIYNPYQVLVSEYDHFVGHLVAVWLIFILLLLVLYRRVRDY